MANVTLKTEKKDDKIKFEVGKYYQDTTTNTIFIAANIDDEYDNGRALVSIESGYRYHDDDDEPFGGDEGDFRKLYPGETITIEVD